MYVQRNASGNIVARFANAQSPNQEFVQGAELWIDPKETTKAQILEKLGKVGLSQSWQLEGFMAGTLSLGLAQGLTEPQMYELNPGYRDAKDLLSEVRTLEAQI